MTPFPFWILLFRRLNYTKKEGVIVFLYQKTLDSLQIAYFNIDQV